MADKGRLPPKPTVAWGKLKDDLVAKVDQVVRSGANPEAKKALARVSLICRKYKKATKAAVTDILRNADPNLDDIADVTRAFGSKISATLSAMPRASSDQSGSSD